MEWATGYVPLPRAAIDDLTSSPRDHAALLVLVAILARARYSQPGRRGGVDLDIGQAVVGQRELAGQLGLDRKVVRTALAKLAARGYIDADERSNGTVVTVIGWKSTATPQHDAPAVGPRPGPLAVVVAGPPETEAIDRYPHEKRSGVETMKAHTSNDDEARGEAHDGPTTGPRRAPNEEEKEDHLSLGSGSSPSGLPDPATSVRADLETPPARAPVATARIVALCWAHASQRSVELAAEGIPVPWPLHVSREHRGRRRMEDRVNELLVALTPEQVEARVRNRIDVAAAKARADNADAQWFTPMAMFSEDSFDSFADLTPESVRKPARAGPHRSAPAHDTIRTDIKPL